MILTCLACGESKEVTDTPYLENWWNHKRGQICKGCLNALSAQVVATSE